MASSSVAIKQLHAVAARDVRGGIGNKGRIPWPRLATDLKFMRGVTTETSDPAKQNAVLLGRLTWNSLPRKLQPLPGRFNVVISTTQSEIPGAHLVCPSLEVAMGKLLTPPLSNQIESIYNLGGSRLYKAGMESQWCGKLYMTEVLQEFSCDVFFPEIDQEEFTLVEDDPAMPAGLFEENGVKFKFVVYEKRQK